MRPRPDLRAEIPRLEPDPVLLAQLSGLAAHSVPSTPPIGLGWRIGAASVAAGALVVGGSWVAGAVPGAPSPIPAFRHVPAPAPSPGPATHSPDAGGDRHGDPTAPDDDGTDGSGEGSDRGRGRRGSPDDHGTSSGSGRSTDGQNPGGSSGGTSGDKDGRGSRNGRGTDDDHSGGSGESGSTHSGSDDVGHSSGRNAPRAGVRRHVTSDDQVITAAKQGDAEAWRALYLAHAGRLVRWLERRPNSAESGDDLASESWLTAASKIADFHGTADEFAGWLFGIARNLEANARRKAQRRATFPVATMSTPPVPGHADELAATDWVQTTLALLPERERDVLTCQEVIGLDGPATARALGVSTTAVRVARHRGLRRLRGLLDQGVGPADLEPSTTPSTTLR